MTPDRFIAAAFREFVAETANVPIGHEDNQRGASTYNWRTSIAAKIAGRAAELARESVGDGGLLPCPFCGSRARLEGFPADEDSIHWYAKCFGCGATNGENHADSSPDQEFAITAWNTRAAGDKE